MGNYINLPTFPRSRARLRIPRPHIPLPTHLLWITSRSRQLRVYRHSQTAFPLNVRVQPRTPASFRCFHSSCFCTLAPLRGALSFNLSLLYSNFRMLSSAFARKILFFPRLSAQPLLCRTAGNGTLCKCGLTFLV